MSGQRLISALLVSAALPLVLAACAASTPKPRAEDFQQTETYSRAFASPGPVTCDAGKRALMSQGYFIDKAESGAVTGHKSFQEAEDNMHTQIQFQMICSPNEDTNGTTVFVNAVRDRYAIKRSATSASVGVSILGSVSMPIGSSADSLVKVASETISRSDYYDGFFNLLKKNLPQVADANANPESKPARHAPAKKAEPAPAPDAKSDGKTDAFKSDATGPVVPGDNAQAAPAPTPAPAPPPTPAPAAAPPVTPPSSTPPADAPAAPSSSSGSAPASPSSATPAPASPAATDAAAPASTPPASGAPATP
jgi:hypothetical protein